MCFSSVICNTCVTHSNHLFLLLNFFLQLRLRLAVSGRSGAFHIVINGTDVAYLHARISHKLYSEANGISAAVVDFGSLYLKIHEATTVFADVFT